MSDTQTQTIIGVDPAYDSGYTSGVVALQRGPNGYRIFDYSWATPLDRLAEHIARVYLSENAFLCALTPDWCSNMLEPLIRQVESDVRLVRSRPMMKSTMLTNLGVFRDRLGGRFGSRFIDCEFEAALDDHRAPADRCWALASALETLEGNRSLVKGVRRL